MISQLKALPSMKTHATTLLTQLLKYTERQTL